MLLPSQSQSWQKQGEALSLGVTGAKAASNMTKPQSKTLGNANPAHSISAIFVTISTLG
jgi:hypothetical protein